MKDIKQYDAIIIGFGKGGKTLAATLGDAGKQTLLIEKSEKMYGGTCINVGCIPTKFLINKAKYAKDLTSFAQKQSYYKLAVEEELSLTDKLRAKNLIKLESTPNVTVITGVAKFRSSNSVEVEMQDCKEVFEGKQIFINTGSVPIIPHIDGIKDNPCVVTSEELLRQFILPKHLFIIGAGYIGVEFASMYTDFGSDVTLVQNDSVFLPREDREIADAVYESLKKRGIKILTSAEIKSVMYENEKAIVTVKKGGTLQNTEADAVLIATGRKANTAELCLENAGVALTDRGAVLTDEYLKTTNPRIYAMGDVNGGLQFTYISLDDFRIVRSGVLDGGRYTKNDRGAVPYSVFIAPPFARVGLTEEEARAAGYSVKIARLPASAIPKALVLENSTGALKAIIDERTGLILGAHLFCEEAHEMINIVKLAIDAKLKYTVLRDMIFTHPTMSEALNELFNV